METLKLAQALERFQERQGQIDASLAEMSVEEEAENERLFIAEEAIDAEREAIADPVGQAGRDLDGEPLVQQREGALNRARGQAGEHVDLVLLDLWIDGGMGGLEASRRIKEIDPNAKLIAISGDGGHEVMQRFNEHNFAAAIAKPFSIDAVEGIVRRFF